MENRPSKETSSTPNNVLRRLVGRAHKVREAISQFKQESDDRTARRQIELALRESARPARSPFRRAAYRVFDEVDIFISDVEEEVNLIQASKGKS